MTGGAARAGRNADASTVTDLSDLDRHLELEAARAARRRAQLFGRFEHDQHIDAGPDAGPGNWALALSGGGIRSATFCLGVLQGLAQPGAKAVAGLPPRAKAAYKDVPGLLSQFDYVSSVSGGGFTAGFLQSLYVKQRGAPQVAAAEVNRHLAEEPPPRVCSGVTPSPLAWLRENGRYLAPSGAGDMAYAFGFGVRNWLGIQSVIGAPLVLATALLALAAQLIAWLCPTLDPAWWWLPLAALAGWVLPSAGAYWMTRDVPDGTDCAQLPLKRVRQVIVAGVICVFVGLPLWVNQSVQLSWEFFALPNVFGNESHWPRYLTVCGTVLLATVGWALAVRGRGGNKKNKGDLAVALTHLCARGIKVVGLLLVLCLVLELAHEMRVSHHPHPILISGGGAGILAIAYRAVMKIVPLLRGAGSSLGANRGIPRRALGLALSVLGIVLLLGVAVFWAMAAQWLMVTGGPDPWASIAAAHQTSFQALASTSFLSAFALVVLALAFVVVVGRWKSILDMSSYHHFYSSRLTRAYLGAANPLRTTACAPPAPPSPPAPGATVPNGVTRFVAGDAVAYATYHTNPAAPLHLINATLNQTVDGSEELVQRDRKGKPFVVLPALGARPAVPSVDVAIGGIFARVTGAGAELSIGDWLAVSGAAVSTGMGRQTSAGAAICVTLANARIGRWWAGPNGKDGRGRRALPTYAYLLDEMRAKFQGDLRELLYLTDGGHFENTATYELLRRVRNRDTAVRFILMTDCGADPEYRYDDLANLVRLARVDFQLEIEVDNEAASDEILGTVFGTPATMGRADVAHLDTRCAILLNVRDNGETVARIVMIKPRLIACASNDLLGYYKNNEVFPQQTTGDQFFDDEQWESYRKLGVECCRAVLNLGSSLWAAVL